jgi:hypothetical protein
MKSFTLSVFFLFTVYISFAQPHTFNYHRWSDSLNYRVSPQPLITGNTAQSDSMALLMNAREVYESNGVFYFINSWADYYLWYVAKYPEKFRNPRQYKQYYESGNNYGMVRFVKKNFKGLKYPAQINVLLEKEYAENDRDFNKWEKKLIAKEKYKEKYGTRSNVEEKQQYNNSVNSSSTEDSKKK